MPFDGAGSPAYGRLQKIDAITDLLARPEGWCKGALTSHNGRHCIRGAMIAAGAIDLEAPVLQAIQEVAGRRFRRIEAFNDHPATEHAQVLQVLTRARDNAMTGRLACPAVERSSLRARVGSIWATARNWFEPAT